MSEEGLKQVIHAVAYARVSTEDHDQDPESQLVRIRSFAKERGITIVGEYQDKSTGTNLERSGFYEMMGKLQFDPSISMCIVLSADRLSRDMQDTNDIVKRMNALGKNLMQVSDPTINIATKEGMLMNNFKSYGAQSYTDEHALKVKAGLQKARERGVVLGRPLKRSQDKIKTDMLLIFAERGYSLNQVCKTYGCSRMTITRRLQEDGKLEEYKKKYEEAIQGRTGAQ